MIIIITVHLRDNLVSIADKAPLVVLVFRA